MKKEKSPHPPLEIRIYGDQLLTKQYLDDFKDDLLTAIGDMLNAGASKVSKQWLKSGEVKKLMNISSGTLQTMRSSGVLPYTKIGGLIYYNAQDIHKMLDGKKRPSPVKEGPK
jgi:hypothetical protein